MVITPTAIWVTLSRLWGIHNVFDINLLEPYQISIQGEDIQPAQVLRDYDNFIAKDCMIDKIMGS
jgi:hypothetical protein